MTPLPAAPRPRPPAFAGLPVATTAAGAPRRVGVEVEFLGLGARAAAAALRAAFGGRLEEEDAHAFLVRGGRLGDLGVELDVRHAHPARQDGTVPVRLGPRTAGLLGWALGRAAPRELVTPPLRVGRLGDVDRAVAALRAAGATGRGGGPLVPLGLHFNVDPPDLEPATLARYLKAYLLLEGWLRRGAAGAARWPRLPARYPEAYARRVVDPGYRPDGRALLDDYLAANPTRDRGLDLLPILLHLDAARVRARLPHEKIGGRPVLHHRMAKARVGEPGWGIAADWNRWVAVERLAGDPDRLARLGRARLGPPPGRTAPGLTPGGTPAPARSGL